MKSSFALFQRYFLDRLDDNKIDLILYEFHFYKWTLSDLWIIRIELISTGRIIEQLSKLPQIS